MITIKKVILMMIPVTIIYLLFIIYNRGDDTISNIKAEYFNISYGQSYYEGINKVSHDTTKLLINDYNKIKTDSTTNQEIDYDKSISIIFVNNDKISGQVTIDNNGICHIGDNPKNFIIDKDNKIYKDGMKAYEELKGKYE